MLTLLCFFILSIFVNLFNTIKAIRAKNSKFFFLNLSIPTFILIVYSITMSVFSHIYKDINPDYITVLLSLLLVVSSFFIALQSLIIGIKCFIYKETNFLPILFLIILIAAIAPAINIICIPMFYFFYMLLKQFCKKNNNTHTYLYLNLEIKKRR